MFILKIASRLRGTSLKIKRERKREKDRVKSGGVYIFSNKTLTLAGQVSSSCSCCGLALVPDWQLHLQRLLHVAGFAALGLTLAAIPREAHHSKQAKRPCFSSCRYKVK